MQITVRPLSMIDVPACLSVPNAESTHSGVLDPCRTLPCCAGALQIAATAAFIPPGSSLPGDAQTRSA
ncbi:MAG: hypothetical protein ABNH17_05370 [Paracoccus sp. (in: a-proteobacteria)]|uniref:hypothetical protein n=1 Tax=Paracoccus sp. TaxID=267 RepID=UPI00308F6DF0